MTGHHRVTECPSMRSADCLAVVGGPVVVIVTLLARQQGAIKRAELCAAMLFVTGNAPDARVDMRLDHRRGKSIRGVTRRTLCLNAGRECMARRARTGISSICNGRRQAEFGSRVGVRDRRGGKS